MHGDLPPEFDTSLLMVGDRGERKHKAFNLRLRRYRATYGEQRKPVLLLHGANNSSDAFLAPGGGLARHLRSRGFDVWLLDWRASHWVLQQPPLSDGTFGPAALERQLFSVDHVAREDIVLALRAMRYTTRQPISIVGFCVAGAALSTATACGALDEFDVDALVFMTLGVFPRSPWDTWMKSREFILDQCIAESPEVRRIDPHHPQDWPAPLADGYARWPEKLKPAGAPEWFRRLTFMYGEPYARPLVDGVLLDPHTHFGPLHLGFYSEAARLLRRGHIAELDRTLQTDPLDTTLQERFRKRRVTLIGGAQDRLWHRESLDLMYEWLLRAPATTSQPCEKHILTRYAHNDLLWAASAPQDVFEKVVAGLGSSKPHRPLPLVRSSQLDPFSLETLVQEARPDVPG